MSVLLMVLKTISMINLKLLRLGCWVGILAMSVMVAAILIQVVARYLFNNALPWPDEAARFCMLWMTGLMAPTAFRRGSFVALDIISNFLSKQIATFLNLLLLLTSLLILLIAVQIGWKEVTGFGGKFATASLYLPSFDGWFRVPRSWMMLSLLVGIVLLISVNIEMIIRKIILFIGGEQALLALDVAETKGAD
ncbi:MAG: TRAP transporter small permease subunit [Tateyamaria sp.]|nr:TRAP transporter small permease subunit [Tateyamaria sp.]MBT5303349.1 TRAP transporter small permease subunit [Tateyamaria sp.]MBT6342168.1 TRAP transporter small permease subunit [Tateyamaria sp.]MBT7802157.1 TRAP transporter small permease subunit [Tateyamaria sp.]